MIQYAKYMYFMVVFVKIMTLTEVSSYLKGAPISTVDILTCIVL